MPPNRTRAAGFINGPLEHHLDHLAPFCSLMQIPLVLTDEDLLQKARLYYPDLELLYWDCLEAPFEVVRSFDTLFYSTPRCMFDEVFFIAEATLGKKIKTIWLPHGNSDKGHASLLMEGLKDEETLLVYGPKMIDFLKNKNVFRPFIPLGNFRFEYYHRHKKFYDSLIQELALPPKKTILYAPTWQDGENSTSFFQAARALIKQLHSDVLLLIKLHPNLEKDIRVLQFVLQNETHPNIRFLSGFTPVYPILDKADLYLGDFSSVGYDFLTFNRPMFFFNPTGRDPSDPGLYLHRCGQILHPGGSCKTAAGQKIDDFDVSSQGQLAGPCCADETMPEWADEIAQRELAPKGRFSGAHEFCNCLPDQIFNILTQDQSHLTQVREATYAYTFGKSLSWDLVQQEILKNIR